MRDALREDPLFLLYRHRSGSTYLAELLSRHPAICIAPESNLMLTLLARGRNHSSTIASAEDLQAALEHLYQEEKLRDWAPPLAELAARLTDDLPMSLAELGREILRAYCTQRKPGHIVWGIKKGVYLLHLPALMHLYPRGKFLHLVRDGRAVLASSMRARHSRTGLPFERDVVRAASEWVRGIQLFTRHAEKCDALQITYENLIRTPEQTLAEVLAFLELPSTPAEARALLEPQAAFELTRNAAHLHPNIHQPPKPERIEAWQRELAAEDILDFEAIAEDDLERAGYVCLSDPKRRRARRAALTWRRLRHRLERLHK